MTSWLKFEIIINFQLQKMLSFNIDIQKHNLKIKYTSSQTMSTSQTFGQWKTKKKQFELLIKCNNNNNGIY